MRCASYETTGRANVLRGVHRLAERATEAYENARAEVATFLGVPPMEIVFTGGCTAAINLVAYSYGSLLKPRRPHPDLRARAPFQHRAVAAAAAARAASSSTCCR